MCHEHGYPTYFFTNKSRQVRKKDRMIFLKRVPTFIVVVEK